LPCICIESALGGDIESGPLDGWMECGFGGALDAERDSDMDGRIEHACSG
jgi:hypothetical protein